MAEMTRQLTQAEIDRILFNQSMGLDPRGQVPMPSVQNLQQRTSGTIAPVAPNFAQLAAGGANRVGQFLNKILPNAQQVVAANPLNLEQLFPTTAQPQVTIPTGFNFAPKQAPTGEVIPGGLQSQQVNLNQLLSAIKPADVLGVSGAERAYTDIGMGKAPNTMDVIDTLALGAGGMAAGRGLLKAGKGLPVGMSIQEATGLLQTAPKSDIGFYSAVEQAAMASPRKSATGQAFLNDIMKGPDVRADEIKWMGLDEFLKGKQNVTKQEVQDYIANNRVDVQEVQLGTNPTRWEGNALYVNGNLAGEIRDTSSGYAWKTPDGQYNLLGANRMFDAVNKVENNLGVSVPETIAPKFGQYTLPGGENYRELLLTMPSNMSEYNKYTKALREKYGEGGFANLPLTDIERARLDKFYAAEDIDPYKSTHFPQENILAHLRVNDRVDADGKKMLLIEEVQSDWHQAGREKGYKGTSGLTQTQIAEKQQEIFRRFDAGEITREQRNAEIDNLNSAKENLQGVPDAPFKDTWYQLALKRAIQHAAENGYDRIGLTTAERQIKRYPDEKNVKGMEKYYDEIYPKFLDKYGKKWGARVGETTVPTDRANVGGMPSMYPNQEPIRYLDITPEMKAGVSKGQPLFQAAPIIGTGLLGSQQEDR